MRLQAETREEPDINLTSLIDVVFLLLIFFMVSTTFERQAVVKVDLPEASSEVAPVEAERLELVIDAQGNMYLDDRALINKQRTTLRAAVLDAAGDDRGQTFTLRADANTPHQYVVTAMDVLAELGFTNLSIATVQIEENP